MTPFTSSSLLLERAQKHITDFEAIERSFIEQDPYTVFTEFEPASGQTVYKVRVTKEVPRDLPAIVFDIINGLRSALDHAVYDATRELVGGVDPKPKDTKFPFGRTLANLEDDLKKVKAVPDSLKPFLLTFKSYEAGDRALYSMNKIRNGVIHRVLEAVPISSGSLAVNGAGLGGPSNFHISEFSSHWDDGKKELTFLRTEGPCQNVQFNISVNISFSDSTGFGRKRAVETLRQLLEIVAGIVKGIEAETARLKGMP